MAKLQWDQVGDREFETGVSHGVLYIPDGDAIPWNGLTQIQENVNDSSTPYFLDGVKYMDLEVPGDFEAVLKAFTYPEEFEEYNGLGNFGNGLFVDTQKPKLFGLSYRTKKGNDLVGTDLGYRIHILFGLMAIPESKNHNTLGDSAEAQEFGWTIVGRTFPLGKFRPTTHIIIDPDEIDPELFPTLEEILYGSDSAPAGLPTVQEFLDIATTFASITITDNGDGTWTAEGLDRFFTMNSATEFTITDVDVEYLDANTYVVETSYPLVLDG